MKRVLIDTNVLVVGWRNPDVLLSEPNNVSKCINSVTYIEFLQGANNRQRAKTKIFLESYEHIRLDAIICDKAIDLINMYSHSEGLRLADALIAATCLVLDLDLLTFNRRHFQKIADLKLI